MLKNLFCMTDEGEKISKQSCIDMGLFNIVSMLPVVLLALVTKEMLNIYFGKTQEKIPLIGYFIASLVMLVLIFITYKITYLKKYIASEGEGAKLRITIAEKIHKLPLSYIGGRDLSDLTSTIMDDAGNLEKTISTQLSELFGGVISCVLAVVLLAFYNWKMTLALSACLPFAVIIMLLTRKITESTNRNNKKKKLAISDKLQEYLENIKLLRCSEKKKVYQDELSKTIKHVIPGLVLYEFLSGITITIAYNLMRFGLASVIITGSVLLIKGEIDVFCFFLFLYVSVRIYEPLSSASERLAEIVYSLLSADRIRDLLNYPVQGGKDIQPKEYDINFKKVSFGYNEEKVLNDVSFTAKQGEITALVGPSGCGKSTLCKLAARFYDVNNGVISVGGIPINDIAPDSLYKNFSFVFQDVVLFNDTIFNNIKIGKQDATKEEVIKAAKLACCEEFINRLPNGYDTVIGENGKTLSGGERQRLSIARAFLKDAPIILLDESTASIDPENETKIQEAIGKLIKNKTVLIIAHKLRSIVDSDKIVVLKEGRVEESGTHEQLMNNKGLYHKLFELQSESSSWALNSN